MAITTVRRQCYNNLVEAMNNSTATCNIVIARLISLRRPHVSYTYSCHPHHSDDDIILPPDLLVIMSPLSRNQDG